MRRESGGEGAARAKRSRLLALGVLAACLASAARADYAYERSFPAYPGWRNLYFTGFPDTIGLADIANSNGPWTDKCNIAGIGGDGVINADDAICTFWGDGAPRRRQGVFDLYWLDPATCMQHERRAEMAGPLGAVFMGEPFPIEAAHGYQIMVRVDRRNPVATSNRGTLTGPCQPGFPSQVVSVATCPRMPLPVPDDAVYHRAAEILCGRQGVDWVDANGDGKPDTCPNGVYDAVSGKRVSLTIYDNEPGNNEFPGTDNHPIAYSVERVLGNFVFSGTNFSLPPGQAILCNLLTGYQPRTYAPPVDDSLCQ